MSDPRPAAPGRTRTCPHCKATILESASVCPGCRHHLRFDPEARKAPAARSVFRVDGSIQHPPDREPWEYCIVVTVKNDRNDVVARKVIDVGALQTTEQRTFELSVDVLPTRVRPGIGSTK